MTAIQRAVVALTLLVSCTTASAGGIALLESDMVLVPPIDAQLVTVFEADYSLLQTNLSTPGFSESWIMEATSDAPSMSHIFTSVDGLAELTVVMDSVLELSDETWDDVDRFDFRYAHPALNDVSNPTTWLTMSDTPSSIPEASGLVLLAIGSFLSILTLFR